MSKLEFLMYVLDHLSIADSGEMEAICRVFDALDDDNDGTIQWRRARPRLQQVYSSISTREIPAYEDVRPARAAPPSARAADGGARGGGSRLAKNLMHPRHGGPSSSAQAPLLPVQSPPALPPRSAPHPGPHAANRMSPRR